jgi:hypothetical protein
LSSASQISAIVVANGHIKLTETVATSIAVGQANSRAVGLSDLETVDFVHVRIAASEEAGGYAKRER